MSSQQGQGLFLAVLFGVFSAAAGWADAPSRPVHVAVLFAPRVQRSAAEPALHVKLKASRLAATANAEDDSREWTLDAPGDAKVELPRDSGWSLAIDASGFWAPPQVLLPTDAGGETAAFPLLPTGTIAGRVSLAPQEKRPAQLTARFQSAPSRRQDGVPESTVSCPVHGERWECQLPAALLDLRVSAEGFIPRYFFGVEVKPAKRSELGTIELARGASVIGRVEVEGTLPPGKVPVVEIVPSQRAGRPATRAAKERVGERTLSVRPGERGFFQATGIPAGAYQVSARLTGFVAASSPVVTVRTWAETDLREPLVLSRPLAVQVQLEPPLDPYGQPWRCQLLSDPSPTLAARSLELAAEGMVDARGLFQRADLTPGPYVLMVRDMTGSDWLNQDLEIAADKTAFEFKLDRLQLEGKLSAGGKPLEATLWFIKPRALAPRIRFDSDAGGAFSGPLPNEGEWWVDLERPGGGMQALATVDVKRSPGSAVARVELRVPNTQLTVVVQDEHGKPVPGAEILVMGSRNSAGGKTAGRETGRTPAQLLADEHGEAVLRGLPPGGVRLYAHYGSASSDVVDHSVVEDREDPALPLVLREKVHVTGYVMAAEGPVPGALVLVLPNHPEGMLLGRAVSDADGRFEVLLDHASAAGGGGLAVFAPGFAARMMPAPPLGPSGQDFRVVVDQEAGDLLVDVSGTKDPMAYPILVHNGASVPLRVWSQFGQAAPAGGGRLALALLEPGEYALCPQLEGRAATAGCRSGWLAGGGKLELGLGRSADRR